MVDNTQFAREFLRRLGITNFDRIQQVEILISATKHDEKCEIKLRVDTEPENMLAFRVEEYEAIRKSDKVDGVPAAQPAPSEIGDQHLLTDRARKLGDNDPA